MYVLYDTKVIDGILKDITIPKMIPVRQIFERDKIDNVSLAVKCVLNQEKIKSTINPEMRIAITCGSRGITNLSLILREICNFVKERGGQPFIVPAMGSHGGATAEGQRKILEDKGVTEKYCGCPIFSSMETIEIGRTPEGEPVFLDKFAASSNGIILVGRIKPHTDFQARYESGLMKMMAVGLGKQKGAESVHKKGPDYVGSQVALLGSYVLEKSPILFGIGLVENAYDETKIIKALAKDEIKEEEPQLLKQAYRSMARILFKNMDLLIVDEIGKEISGTGADPNVTGRFATNCKKEGVSEASKLIFLDLTKATDGNAVGVGLCDITTLRLYNKIDFVKTYANSITSTILSASKIPVITENDRQAVRLGIYSSNCTDMSGIKIVRIKNTMELSEIFISEALLSEAQQNPQIEILEAAQDMRFDKDGYLIKF